METTATLDPPKIAPLSPPAAVGEPRSTGIPADPQTVTETVECRECGENFTYEMPTKALSAKILRLLTPKICADCAPIVDARHQAEILAREKAERQKERDEEWLTACPPLYRGTEMDKLPKESVPGVEAIAAWQYGPQGLGLCGLSGYGKTRIMFLLCQRMLRHEGRRFIYVSSADFSHKVSRLASKDVKDLDDYLNRLCGVSILFLDDLGKGRMTDRVESELYHVIEQRTANLKPILFTANASGSELSESMSIDRGEPIIRRLREFCNVVML